MKKHLHFLLSVTALVSMFAITGTGQSTQPATQVEVPQGVPRLVKFSGFLKDATGNLLTNAVGITFAIYSEQTGGVPLWQETQNVQFLQGRYTVFLGDTKSTGIPAELFAFGQPRWLGIQVLQPGETEQPRVLLASVPYALKAVDADTLGGLPASAYLKADTAASVLSPAGGASGTTVVAATSSAAVTPASSLTVTTPGGTVGTIPEFSGSSVIVNSPITDTSGVIGTKNLENIRFADQFSGSDCGAKINAADLNLGSTIGEIWINQNCGITWTSQVKLSTNHTLRFVHGGVYVLPNIDPAIDATANNVTITGDGISTGIKQLNNATAILVGTGGKISHIAIVGSNNAANISNQGIRSGNSSDVTIDDVYIASMGGLAITTGGNSSEWFIRGNYLIANKSEGIYVGVGSSSVQIVNNVVSGSGQNAIDYSGSFGTIVGNQIFNTGDLGTPDNNNGIVLCAACGNNTIDSTVISGNSIVAATDHGIELQCAGGTLKNVTVVGNSITGTVAGDGIRLIYSSGSGICTGNTIMGNTIHGNDGYGVEQVSGGTGTYSNNVLGPNSTSSNTLGDYKADYVGVTSPKFDRSGVGIQGTTVGQFHALFGDPSTNSFLDIQPNGGRTFVFDGSTGNLTVPGTLIAGSKSFKIDHPLDPVNKYLSHTSVESPEMLNLYSGVITLNSHGAGWVRLPAYFGALNENCRYQLTSIGRPQPGLYVAREVSENRFKIAGGNAAGRVSWQVTGIRHDAFANAHRNPVEEEKPAGQRGHYLNPELYGGPEDAQARNSEH